MNKNLNLLYFSATENTKEILKTISSKISDDYTEYDITSVNNREESYSFTSDDILIVGVPVYGGRIPVFLVDFFKKIEGDNTPAVFITTFGNRDYDDALLELKDIFEKNGFIGIAAAAFISEHSKSKKIAGERPDEKDLKTAENFGAKIKKMVENITDFKRLSELKIKGDYPYKKRSDSPDMAPKTTDDCIECGICAENCPMNAISFVDFKDIDEKKCITCCSCIQKCPVNAKYIDHPRYTKVKDKLIANFSDIRKEPELFVCRQ